MLPKSISLKRCLILIMISSFSLLSGCGLKPWVKPYERNYLADEIMQIDRNPVSNSYTHHVYQAREGSRGAEGGSGGGCGCN